MSYGVIISCQLDRRSMCPLTSVFANFHKLKVLCRWNLHFSLNSHLVSCLPSSTGKWMAVLKAHLCLTHLPDESDNEYKRKTGYTQKFFIGIFIKHLLGTFCAYWIRLCRRIHKSLSSHSWKAKYNHSAKCSNVPAWKVCRRFPKTHVSFATHLCMSDWKLGPGLTRGSAGKGAWHQRLTWVWSLETT